MSIPSLRIHLIHKVVDIVPKTNIRIKKAIGCNNLVFMDQDQDNIKYIPKF